MEISTDSRDYCRVMSGHYYRSAGGTPSTLDATSGLGQCRPMHDTVEAELCAVETDHLVETLASELVAWLTATQTSW